MIRDGPVELQRSPDYILGQFGAGGVVAGVFDAASLWSASLRERDAPPMMDDIAARRQRSRARGCRHLETRLASLPVQGCASGSTSTKNTRYSPPDDYLSSRSRCFGSSRRSEAENPS